MVIERCVALCIYYSWWLVALLFVVVLMIGFVFLDLIGLCVAAGRVSGLVWLFVVCNGCCYLDCMLCLNAVFFVCLCLFVLLFDLIGFALVWCLFPGFSLFILGFCL